MFRIQRWWRLCSKESRPKRHRPPMRQAAKSLDAHRTTAGRKCLGILERVSHGRISHSGSSDGGRIAIGICRAEPPPVAPDNRGELRFTAAAPATAPARRTLRGVWTGHGGAQQRPLGASHLWRSFAICGGGTGGRACAQTLLVPCGSRATAPAAAPCAPEACGELRLLATARRGACCPRLSLLLFPAAAHRGCCLLMMVAGLASRLFSAVGESTNLRLATCCHRDWRCGLPGFPGPRRFAGRLARLALTRLFASPSHAVHPAQRKWPRTKSSPTRRTGIGRSCFFLCSASHAPN